MKYHRITVMTATLILCVFFSTSFSQDVTVVAPTSEAAEGLDLQAVAELFKDSKDLETFEKKLNDPDLGINNLDLDNNGEIDFIRVVEEVGDDAHVIILQVPLAKDQYQDVATIEVEKNDTENYNMQVRGNVLIYGPDYYITPIHVHVHTWHIIPWIFHPRYHPYRSLFYFGNYPPWWRPWKPVHLNVYRTRVVKINVSASFQITKTSHVTRVTKVNYKPSSSTLVKKQTSVTRTGDGDVRKTTRTSRTTTDTRGRTTEVDKFKREKTDSKSGEKTTIRAGRKEVTNPRSGEQTVVKGASRTTKTDDGKTKTTIRGKKKTR